MDVYLPDYKIAIEYDGKEFHKNYGRDYDKIILCKKTGIRLIHVREEGCPTLVGVPVIDVKPSNYPSLEKGIKELLKLLDSKYGITIPDKVNLKRDLQKIIEKKYSVKKKNSIGTLYPVLADMLQSDVSPYVIPSKSNIPFDWKCPDCGNVWPAPVYSVVKSFLNGSYGCKKCAGLTLVKGKNDAASKDPIAASLWDREQNGDDLSEYVYSDESVKFWNCIECGTSFQRAINVMCRKGSAHACDQCTKMIRGRTRRNKLRSNGDNLLEKCP